MMEFMVRNLDNKIIKVSGVKPLASVLCKSEVIFIVTTPQDVFICVVEKGFIKVASESFKDIIKQLRNALFDERASNLYYNMCSGCERERWCHEYCEHCDEYEDAYIELEEKFFGGNDNE